MSMSEGDNEKSAPNGSAAPQASVAPVPPASTSSIQPANSAMTAPEPDDIRLYFKTLWSILKAAPTTDGTLLYLAIIVVGCGAVTWLIPEANESERSPETLGVFVIGILITVFAEAMFLWKKGNSKTHNYVSQTAMGATFLLAFFAYYLSVKHVKHVQEGKNVEGPSAAPIKDWVNYSVPTLWAILILAILLWAMISAADPRFKNVSTEQSPIIKNLANGRPG